MLGTGAKWLSVLEDKGVKPGIATLIPSFRFIVC